MVSRQLMDLVLCCMSSLLHSLEPAKPDQGSCRFEVTGLDGTFSRADIPEEKVNHSRHYQVPLDCTWVVTVAEGHRVYVIRNYLVLLI